jgi:Flp pilus assembly protein TadD
MVEWMLAAALAAAAPASAAAPLQGTPAAVTVAPAPTEAPLPSSSEQILALPAELRARLHEEVIRARHSRSARFEQLVNFVFDASGLGMSYQVEPTPTVAEAYATRKANCLGFTLLFVALAREAGIDANPQEIRETLSWRQDEGTIYRSSHVNAAVRIGPRSYTVDVARDAVVGRFDPERISDERLLAHYHNNLAIERLSNGEIEVALRHVHQALKIDPEYAGHWTNAGVLYLRNGDLAAAEKAYTHALKLNPREVGALFNLVSLSKRNGDLAGEKRYRHRLGKVQKTDPFYHFLLAKDFERQGDFAKAISHYQRAIQWHRDEHRFFAALARVYLLSGDTERAGKALARAQALSEGPVRAAYGAKLDRLR